MDEQGKKKVGIRYHLNIIFTDLSQRNTTFIASVEKRTAMSTLSVSVQEPNLSHSKELLNPR